MKNFDKLPDIFHATDAYSQGLTPADLQAATSKNVIERRMRGVYKKTESEDLGEWTNYEVLAKGLKKPFAVCLLSALSYYGLTDQILEESWILVENNNPIRHNHVRFFRSRKPRWDVGIVHIHGIPFTTLERTIVECLVHQKSVSPNEAHRALVVSISKGQTKPWDIANVADQMGFKNKIHKYLEPFIYAG